MGLCGAETSAKVDRLVWYTVFDPIEKDKREADVWCCELAHRNCSEIEAGNFNMFSWVFLGPSWEIPVWYLKSSHCRFHPHHFQLIIY